MTLVAFIGSGYTGTTIARLAVTAGYDVVLCNSRGPQTLDDLVADLGPHASAAPSPDAAAACDFAVVAIPFKAYLDVPVEPLAGKVVLDANNYYPDSDGHFAEIDDGSITSSEVMQRHLMHSYVVKVFNNIYYKHLAALARPTGSPDRSALPITGDDMEAKAVATAFMDAVGYDAFDSGRLAVGRRYQPGTAAYAEPYGSFTDDDGTPFNAASLHDILAATA